VYEIAGMLWLFDRPYSEGDIVAPDFVGNYETCAMLRNPSSGIQRDPLERSRRTNPRERFADALRKIAKFEAGAFAKACEGRIGSLSADIQILGIRVASKRAQNAQIHYRDFNGLYWQVVEY